MVTPLDTGAAETVAPFYGAPDVPSAILLIFFTQLRKNSDDARADVQGFVGLCG